MVASEHFFSFSCFLSLYDGFIRRHTKAPFGSAIPGLEWPGTIPDIILHVKAFLAWNDSGPEPNGPLILYGVD